VVIPVETRRRVGLKPGTKLRLIEENHEIRLIPAVSPPMLVRRKGRLVAVPTVPEDERTPVDLAEMIREERDARPSVFLHAMSERLVQIGRADLRRIFRQRSGAVIPTGTRHPRRGGPDGAR